MLANAVKIADERVEIPDEIRTGEADRSYEDWLYEKAEERGVLEFDPRELNASEARDRLADNDDPHAAGIVRELEDRSTVIEAARATYEEEEQEEESEEESGEPDEDEESGGESTTEEK